MESRNLFEVNGIKYTDNIPEERLVFVTKQQYVEYMQLKEMKSRIEKNIEEYENKIKKLHPASDCVIIDELEIKIEALKELKNELI